MKCTWVIRMTKKLILENAEKIFEECTGNIISAENAICSDVIGVQLYDKPLVGIGSAQDELFLKYKEVGIIGPWYMTPEEWLPNAKTVISLFFPFTEVVKESNRNFTDGPSPAWLHGRIEGQNYLVTYMKKFREWLASQGINGCVPAMDSRFQKIVAGNNMTEYACVNEHTFGSNWSERHAAYVCGLGTFGLSKGLITEKGMAGRFIGIIIDAELAADERKYSGIYDYCIDCGACIRRCPVQAISMEHGKNHNICGAWLKKMGELHAPRYGCGLCQTGVPCESRIPGRRK